jgi:hypothetical protein
MRAVGDDLAGLADGQFLQRVRVDDAESTPKIGMPRHCSLARSGGLAWLGAAVSVRP